MNAARNKGRKERAKEGPKEITARESASNGKKRTKSQTIQTGVTGKIQTKTRIVIPMTKGETGGKTTQEVLEVDLR